MFLFLQQLFCSPVVVFLLFFAFCFLPFAFCVVDLIYCRELICDVLLPVCCSCRAPNPCNDDFPSVARREKQEDRFLVMPDFWKTIELAREEKAGTLRRESPSSERHGSQRSPAVGAKLDSMDGAADVVTAESQREAVAFWGVYDGHCGSEAVQFVSDRLHWFVGGHDDLETVRNVPKVFCAVVPILCGPGFERNVGSVRCADFVWTPFYATPVLGGVLIWWGSGVARSAGFVRSRVLEVSRFREGCRFGIQWSNL